MSTLQVLHPSLQSSRLAFNNIFDTLFNIPPTPLRKIDCVTSRRDVPMKVICLGLSRTGTFSLMTALTVLGYKPYHMVEMVGDASIAMGLLEEAMAAKYDGKGKSYGREEFDRWLGRHDALVELPGHLFPEELLQAYPDAKIVINDRDVDKWIPSIASTLGMVMKWPTWDLIAWADPALVGPWWSAMKAVDKQMHYKSSLTPSRSRLAADNFSAHYDRCRKLCEGREGVLLRFRPQDGWEPLCKLLGKEVPKEAYPDLNDKDLFQALHVHMWWRAMKLAVMKIGAGVVVGGVLGWLAWRSGFTAAILRQRGLVSRWL